MNAIKDKKYYGFNLERKQKATLRASRNRTDDLLRKAHSLGIAEIYTDNRGRIKRKKEN